jgi:hypothetical protein
MMPTRNRFDLMDVLRWGASEAPALPIASPTTAAADPRKTSLLVNSLAM